ncbi:MAG: hypothetical protein ACYTFK_13330, partial [Planctomycetota bacterium]
MGHYGLTPGSRVTNCYATGPVGGQGFVGGLIGFPASGTVESSFYFQDPNNNVGRKVEADQQLKTRSTFTFAGWDFVDETINGPNDIWT